MNHQVPQMITPGKHSTRKAMVLLICMMVIALTSVLTLGVLECLRSRVMLATRVSEETRAELLADAGIQHGVAELSNDVSWRGTSNWIAHPPGSPDQYRYMLESVDGKTVGITGFGEANFAMLQRYMEVEIASRYFLRGTRRPVADLALSPPTSLSPPDYDDDGDPGTKVQETDKGYLETDPNKYLDWLTIVGDFTLNGAAQVKLFSAVKDFHDDKAATVHMYLLDVRDDGSDAQLIAMASVNREIWSPTGQWVEDTFDFGDLSHTLAVDRRLCVRVVVDKDASDDDMLIAYDSMSHDSYLQVMTTDYEEVQTPGQHFLRGSRLPVADLAQTMPTSVSAPDYDDDGKPGTKVKKSKDGYLEIDPAKYLEWQTLGGDFTLNGPAQVELFSAVRDFHDDKGATVHVYLLDVKDDGSDVQLIASATVSRAIWSPTGQWVKDTFDFGNVSHTLAANRRLRLRVVADDVSDDDMYIAYDSLSQNSCLQLTIAN